MNVSTYGYSIIAATALGPRAYGAFAGLMATLLVLGVLQLGLQATAARRISAAPDHVGEIERGILLVSRRAALLLGALTLALSPAFMVMIRLDDLAPALLVAVAIVPMTIMGGQAGILQGERRWAALAVVYLANGIPRILIGTALVLLRPTETSAMVGVAVAAWAPVLVGWLVLRGARPAAPPSEDRFVRRIAWESVRNSQALLAFFAVSNIDVVVARNVLGERDAGLYAGGLILTKAVLFLPQFVVVLAFPSMATAGESASALRRSLAAVGVIGLLATGGAWLLSGLALIFVGGRQYDEIVDSLWLFAVLGTLLAMLQLLVYAVLARQGRRSVYLVWAALVALVLAGGAASSLHALLLTVIAVDGLLLAALLGINLFLLATQPQEASHDVLR
ncbi:MAG TPA: polysaccharide biosynthesis protein [Marmoricola sp.]|nr:polysaccharide biosynthesis protein [Marmoricola sp.]